MTKAGQTGGTEVGRDFEASHLVEAPTKPWVPRSDGMTAVLVTERSTVFDRKAEMPVDGEPVVGALGPMPTEWTQTMVGCRLQHVHTLMRNKLPWPKIPAQYRSFLGEMQPQEASHGRSRGLTTEEELRIDWTMSQIFTFDAVNRAVLMGVMAGHSFETISEVTMGIERRIGGKGLSRSAVFKRYRRVTEALAAHWNRLGVPIDAGAQEIWLSASAKKI